jgi:hypothetical protein
MVDCRIRDSNKNVVDPAKARREVGGAVVAGWSNANKGPRSRTLVKNSIDPVTYTTQSTLECIQRFGAEVEITRMEVWRIESTLAALGARANEFLTAQREARLRNITHSLQIGHPLSTMHICNGKIMKWQ